MICKGDRIKIKASRQLLEMGLEGLCNWTGTVTDVMLTNRTPGVMVRLCEEYEESKFWYIPVQSVVTSRSDGNDKKKTLLRQKVF